MPFSPENRQEHSSKVKEFFDNIPRQMMVNICKKFVSNSGVYFNVSDVVPNKIKVFLNGENAVAIMSEIRLFSETIINRKINISTQAAECLAIKAEIMDNTFIYQMDNRFVCSIFFFGENSKSVSDRFEEYYSKYVFDIPEVLVVIILGKMKTKMEKNRELYIIPCGKNTVVFPFGTKRDEFYKELYSFWENMKLEKINTILKDADAYRYLNELNIKDVFYHTFKNTIFIRGLQEDIDRNIGVIREKIFEEEQKMSSWNTQKKRGFKVSSSKRFYDK